MRDKLYDGKELFETWCSWGAAATGTRLREYAHKKYGGTSQMGGEYAMWKWIFKNTDEAFPKWKDWYFEKYPDRPQPTFEEFTKLVLRKARSNQNIGGSQKQLNRFCAKYNIEFEIRIKKGDVVQVTRRNHPIFQALLIVDSVQDKEVEAFLINETGVRTTYTLSINDIGVIDKAIFERKQGVVNQGNLSRIPMLEAIARDIWTPLKRVEVDESGTQKRYRFVYRNGKSDEYSIAYPDVDEGIREELSRLKNLKESSGEALEEAVQ